MKDALPIIAENFSEDVRRISSIVQKFPAYIEDIGSELLERGADCIGEEELSIAYRRMREELEERLLSLCSKTCAESEVDAFTEALLTNTKPILSAQLALALSKRVRVDSYLPVYENTPARTAYFRNAYSDLAFRRFSRELAQPTVVYCDSFKAVCEEVYTERCDFAILPVESSRDGRLTAVEKLLAKYELAPMLYCTVCGHDEETIRFGLFASAPILPAIPAASARSLELILFSDEEDSLAHLLASASYLGCRATEIAVLPFAQGFLRAWRLVFFCEADKERQDATCALRTLLCCEYPHHLLCGIYRTLEG